LDSVQKGKSHRASIVFCKLWFGNDKNVVKIVVPHFLFFNGLSDPSTQQCNIQKIPFWDFMDGMKLSPTWSASFFLPGLFFLPFYIFFLLATVFFGPTPWPQFFLGKSTSPSNLPTALPPTNPPTSLMPLTSFSTHPPSLELQNQGELQ